MILLYENPSEIGGFDSRRLHQPLPEKPLIRQRLFLFPVP